MLQGGIYYRGIYLRIWFFNSREGVGWLEKLTNYVYRTLSICHLSHLGPISKRNPSSAISSWLRNDSSLRLWLSNEVSKIHFSLMQSSPFSVTAVDKIKQTGNNIQFSVSLCYKAIVSKLSQRFVKSGNKITKGIAMTHWLLHKVSGWLLPWLDLTKHWQCQIFPGINSREILWACGCEILPLNYDPGTYGQDHYVVVMGKVMALLCPTTSQRQLGKHKWGSCKLKIQTCHIVM